MAAYFTPPRRSSNPTTTGDSPYRPGLQSEFLQFWLYLTATVWWLQRGSPESKELGKAGKESDEDQKIGVYAVADSPAWAKTGGWRTRMFSSSLAIVMEVIFLARAVCGRLGGFQ